MSFTLGLVIICGALFLGMLLSLQLGRRLGEKQLAENPEGKSSGLGAIEGAVFGLLGLLVAFTFSGAVSRLDARRQLVVQEANAIGTAYLRLDLLPNELQADLRQSFRDYLDARLEAFRQPLESEDSKLAFRRATELQGQIWSKAVTAVQVPSPTPTAVLVLPAINEMIDITGTRAMALQLHPPRIIFLMLGGLALISALLAGHGMAGGGGRSRVHTVGFSAIFVCTVYVILDVEYPRKGLIRVDRADQMLVDLRASMGR